MSDELSYAPAPEFSPVLVHITGSDLVQDVAKERTKRIALTTHTITLNATNPVLPLCNHEPNRRSILLIVLDNPVVLCDSFGQANAGGNTITTLLTAEGAVLPVSVQPIEIFGTDPLWVTAPTLPARVSIISTTYAEV